MTAGVGLSLWLHAFCLWNWTNIMDSCT